MSRIGRICLLFIFAVAPPGARAGSGDFAGPEAFQHFTRERTYDITHLLLELSFNASTETVFGRATTTLTPLNDGFDKVVLDAVDLHVDSVALAGGLPLASRVDDGKIRIGLDRVYGESDTITFTIVYSAHPKLGVYFVHPDKGYPDKPTQIWSQGEMEESRHWFPCYDAPNDFYTTEMKITVPAGQTAVSNGELVETEENPKAKTVMYHWRDDIPHVTYLTSFAVGRYEKLTDEWNGLPVEYYVDPAEADRAKGSFDHTPDMLRFYSDFIGVAYPYAKYAQVTVEDFRWGGMENHSATTLTRRTLRDARALLDGNSESLVAHELAHQWWGDLLTTRNWNHIWLNEGFATYFDALYTEHARGPDEFLLQMLENRDSYMREDSTRYRRAMVTDTYENPEQMFDSHTYPKGAWVLHMIRYVLGDPRWEKAIRHYAQKFATQNVDTEDFRKAIEEATGEPLDWFFDEWLYHGGHPAYDVSWDWDEGAGVVALHVRQVQKVDDLTPLFRMPIEVEVAASGDATRYRVDIAGADQTLYLPAPVRPDYVQFDPDERVLKALKFEPDRGALLAQLKGSASAGGRIRAARGLARFSDDEAVAGLAVALARDSCRGVRVEAALALGKMATSAARAALGSGFQDPDARVRRRVAEAFGEFTKDQDVLASLREQFRRDSSYGVRAETVKSAAKLKIPEVFEFCVEALRFDSYGESIRSAALEGMAELRDERGIDYALKWSAYGKPQDVRIAALQAIASLAKHDDKRKDVLLDYLIGMLDDPDFRVQRAAIAALGNLGDAGALKALQRTARRAADYRSQSAARKAMHRIETSDKKADASSLAAELGELKRANEDLRLRLERLEAARAASSAVEITETKGASGL